MRSSIRLFGARGPVPSRSGLSHSIHAHRFNVAASLLFLLFIPSASFAQTHHDLVRAGEYVVIRSQVAAAQSNSAGATVSAQLLSDANATTTELMYFDPPSPQFGVPVAAAVLQHAAVEFDPDSNQCDQIKLLDPTVAACSPNFLRSRTTLPSDSFFSAQTNLHGNSPNGVDAPRAWEFSTGSRDVVVAILDGGIDYSHPDLRDNLWTNPSEIPNNGVDDDLNGYVDDVHGINVAARTGDPLSVDAHGTHVAGIIGATGNNAFGVSGVNWAVSLLAVRASDEDGYFSTFDIAKGLDYIRKLKIEQGANVVAVNASFGGFSPSEVEFKAIDHLRDAGILFVAAAGNENQNIDRSPVFPASYQLDNIISVLATDDGGARASFSNYGFVNADIAAPGTNILSTIPFATYGRLDGTSMATPMVTGAIALAAAVRPDLSGQELRTMLFTTAAPLSNLDALTSTGRFLDVGTFITRLVDESGAQGASPSSQSRSPRIVRDASFRFRFQNSSGNVVKRFRPGATLRINLSSLNSLPTESAATIYLRFAVNSRSCGLPVKISEIERNAFVLETLTRGAKRSTSIGVHILNGEGAQVFARRIKNARRPQGSLGAAATNRMVRRTCTSLMESLSLQ